MKYRGCAYYPEQREIEQVETDARLMRAAGLNMARIGEFAWSRMEPRDGLFTLDWLHTAALILERNDIQVLMCTPTAAAPAWLSHAYPETLIMDKHGKRAWHGVRQHSCYVSRRFREYCVRITDKLTREMSVHKNVIAWQIDNEIGCSMFGDCHCGECQRRFRNWLKERYGTLENLNRCWGTVFWSMDYSDWDEIELGDVQLNLAPSRVLDSLRFFSAVKIEFAQLQADIIRANQPQALIVTSNFLGVNPFRGFEKLDRAGGDLYPETANPAGLASDALRSIKADTPFWVTETGIGGEKCPGAPHNGRFRPLLWHFFAHGAEMALVFLWRVCHSGQEQNPGRSTIVSYSGKPRRAYYDLQKCMLEFERLAPQMENLPLPKAQAAIILDHEIEWRYRAGERFGGGRVSSTIGYGSLLGQIHSAFLRRHVLTDIIPPDRKLDGYKLLILSSQAHIEQDFAERLATFVAGGGVVLAAGQLGTTDSNANYLPRPGPEHVSGLFGLFLEDGRWLGRVSANPEVWQEVKMEGQINGSAAAGTAFNWIGDVELNGGKALMRFTEGIYQDQPALIEKTTGNGCALYLAAARVDDKMLASILEHTCRLARVRTIPAVSEQIEIVTRGHMTIVINHTDTAAAVPLEIVGTALIGTYANGIARLAPYDVCVIKN